MSKRYVGKPTPWALAKPSKFAFAAILAAAPLAIAPAWADDLSDSSQCSGYSSIDECVDDAAAAARDEAIDDAKNACSNIDSSGDDAQQKCEDAVARVSRALRAACNATGGGEGTPISGWAEAQRILRSARIAELKMAAGLVQPRPHVELPPDPRRREMCLKIMLAAQRHRSAALSEQLK